MNIHILEIIKQKIYERNFYGKTNLMKHIQSLIKDRHIEKYT